MRKAVEEDGFGWRKLISLIVLVGFLWSIWFLFFSYEDCSNRVCFDENLKDCDNARFIAGDDMIFEYIIRGESKGRCEVEVELLQGELNNEDSRKLEGQTMTCMLPLGAVVDPESDTSVCHGLLKEGLQDLVIRKLYTYLVQNLGRLNLELVGVPQI
jgi:hypothetical protein